jgi:heme/copper-type cytochrome/quinol oxidase subunit 2
MAEKKSSPSFLKQRILLPQKKRPELVSLPTSQSWRYECDTPVIWTNDLDLGFLCDLSFTNHSAVDQQVYASLNRKDISGPVKIFFLNQFDLASGQIFVMSPPVLSGFPYPTGWQFQFFLTSQDVIPSLHVKSRNLELYLSPGDFAIFELPAGFTLPGVM